ncbi:MAG: acyl-homoserine-lactone synthase [Pseudomonadota bacterium]
MIISIEGRDYQNNKHLLDQMHQTRKRVFHEQLGWDVPVQGDWERDEYDDDDPLYLVLTDAEQQTHFASLRLMQTTGPTLLHDVFADTMPNAALLSAPQIWECTRFCVDEINEPKRTFHTDICASSLLLLGLCELGLQNGIEMIVANFDPVMKRIYNKAGCEVEVHGVSNNYGRRPVACGTFEVSTRILRQMREKLNISHSIYEKSGTSAPNPALKAA